MRPLTIREIAEQVGISRQAVYAWLWRGWLRIVGIRAPGGELVVDPESAQEAIEDFIAWRQWVEHRRARGKRWKI